MRKYVKITPRSIIKVIGVSVKKVVHGYGRSVFRFMIMRVDIALVFIFKFFCDKLKVYGHKN